MEIVDDITKLSRTIHHVKAKLIGIDGGLQSGKTSFVAPTIKHATGGHIIHVDAYLKHHARRYLHALDMVTLKNDIHVALHSYPHVIVEGIMLHSILSAMYIHADMYIYACDSLWYNQWEEYYEERTPLSRIIHQEEVMTNRIERALHPQWKYVHFSTLVKELYEYTKIHKPFLHADFIFLIDKYF